MAVSPGHTETVLSVDLNRDGGHVTEPVPFGEMFVLAVARPGRRRPAVLRDAPDDFDQLVFWTETPVFTDAFAFQSR